MNIEQIEFFLSLEMSIDKILFYYDYIQKIINANNKIISFYKNSNSDNQNLIYKLNSLIEQNNELSLIKNELIIGDNNLLKTKSAIIGKNSKIYTMDNNSSKCPLHRNIALNQFHLKSIENNKLAIYPLYQCKKCIEIKYANYYVEEDNKTKIEALIKKKISILDDEVSKYNRLGYITLYDVLVISDIRGCMNHTVIDTYADIKLIKTNGITTTISVFSGYCRQCNRYLILKTEYLNLLKIGQPVCKIINITKSYLKHNASKTYTGGESIAYSYGYSVSAQSKLTVQQRRTILSTLIENNILSVIQLQSLIDSLITRFENRRNCLNAVECWRADKQYITTFKQSHLQHFGTKSIKTINIS